VPKLFSKPPVWASWILISLIQIIVATFVSAALAQSSPNVVTYDHAELNFTLSQNIPTSGWTPTTLPANSLSKRARQGSNETIVAWARLTFDPATFDKAPLALFTENNREGVIIFLNGIEILRNSSDDETRVMGWNTPYLVPLSPALLKVGQNEIVVRASSRYNLNLSIGQVQIGPQKNLTDLYNKQYFVRISGPLAANITMVFLTCAVLLLWVVRRQEHTLLWIALTGFFWFIRDYHFFAYEAPFDSRLFLEVSYYAVFFAMAASLSFCVDFLKLPNRKYIVVFMFGLCILLSIARFITVQIHGQDGLINLVSLLIVVGVTGLMIQSWRKTPTPDHPLLIAVVTLIILLSIHDLGRSSSLNLWEGMGFHAQPFVGLLLFTVFLVSIGRRFVDALTQVEQANQTLEVRVETARNELAKSELARQELQVLNAVESERERLMREMHDGIGSNLITALAIAKQADESPRTIHTLQRAISDLKITVDSLAPVEGDLVALLANFRHRLEPDLREAGLRCVWKVEPCPSLLWLDAVNALQMLRIVQEAISNVLAHANASTVEIGARPDALEGAAGIQVWIHDNGKGLAEHTSGRGRGHGNMTARAASLGGQFSRTSPPGAGTKVVLWLPINRLESSRLQIV
jgi:signal transduction histidine kinase